MTPEVATEDRITIWSLRQDLTIELQPIPLGKHYHQLKITNYFTSEKQHLDCYWTSIETENLTVGH